jgi:hypothetical protein
MSNGNTFMGGTFYGTAQETRTGEILRALRCEIRTQNLQRGIGRYGGVHAQEILLTYMCKLQETSGTLDYVSFKGGKIQEGLLRIMRMQNESTGAPRRPKPGEQRTRKYTDTLQTLSRLLAHDSQEAWQKYCGENAKAFLNPWDGDWEYGIPRVANGVPYRVDRLKGLGNAVVPAQVYPILKAIAEIESL